MRDLAQLFVMLLRGGLSLILVLALYFVFPFVDFDAVYGLTIECSLSILCMLLLYDSQPSTPGAGQDSL